MKNFNLEKISILSDKQKEVVNQVELLLEQHKAEPEKRQEIEKLIKTLIDNYDLSKENLGGWADVVNAIINENNADLLNFSE
jgi:hypothetical protein